MRSNSDKVQLERCDQIQIKINKKDVQIHIKVKERCDQIQIMVN